MNFSSTPFILLLFVFVGQNKTDVDLESVRWIHGSENCAQNSDQPIQIVQYNDDTWVLRQNKCINYEAPFIFLIIGDEKGLLMDTGATSNPDSFPLYKTVREIIHQWEKENKKKLNLIVAHTHSHGDHWAGDAQFKNKPNTSIVGLTPTDVQDYFKLTDWPNKTSLFDLGNRQIEIIPIPGHDATSIALYDQQTQLLLTGDTFYPGRLYVRDWMAFKNSIQRLTDFSSTHQIKYLIGNHIEMSRTQGKDYPTGSTWQPDEHSLPLKIADLQKLNVALEQSGDQPKRMVFDDYIVYPK